MSNIIVLASCYQPHCNYYSETIHVAEIQIQDSKQLLTLPIICVTYGLRGTRNIYVGLEGEIGDSSTVGEL